MSDLETARSVRSSLSSVQTERFVDQDDVKNAKQSNEKISTTHSLISSCLSSSSEIQPVHVEIKNESYWYNMRRRLGAKRHTFMAVKYNETYVRYESYIYRLKLREEDMEMVPTKVHVGDSKTRLAAYKLCEKCCRERDENPATVKKLSDVLSPDKILTTHLRVTVVSEHFHRMTSIERMGVVQEELLRSLGSNLNPETTVGTPSSNKNSSRGLGLSAPCRLKIGSIFGNKVSQLDLFRVLLPPDNAPFTLILDCKTPSQWRPDIYAPLLSERLGTSHVGLRSLQVDDAAKSAKQHSRVKQLTTTVNPRVSTFHRSENNHTPSTAGTLSDSLGLDPLVSGVKYKKLGGIYGHFFAGLSPEIHEMVLNRYKDNKHLIQAEGNVNVYEVAEAKRKARAEAIADGSLFEKPASFQPHTNLSALRAKATAAVHLSEYDKGTTSETLMREEVQISNRRIERVAVRLQRIRRITLYRRAVKRLWWRKYAVLTIQRIIRGVFGRQYARLYSRLKPVAATRIQKCFRHMRSKVFLRVWRWLTFRLTRVVLPKIKRFIRNCFLSWISKRNASATMMQSIVRMYLGRVQFYKRLGERYFLKYLFVLCATQIQKTVRGFLGRRQFVRVRDQVLIDKVDHPAALRLQRIYRGRLAKLLLIRKKYEYSCLIRLQLWARSCVHRIWDTELRRVQRIRRSAIIIQRIQRGRIDRELVRLKRHIIWYNERYIPSVIRVQAVARRYRAQKAFVNVRKRAKAASVIQYIYRNYVVRLAASAIVAELRKAKRFFAATKIQCMVRLRLAKMRFRRMSLEYNGRVIMAAKMIMRAWVNYRVSRKYQYLVQENRHALYARKIAKYIDVRRNIQVDIKEIRTDVTLAEKVMVRLKQRMRELEVFLQQASVRSANVKTEMVKLTTDDFERGWAEALGQEYESLNYQSLMAREELRLLNANYARRVREIADLQFELEEAELEIDTVELVELESAEALRRSEIMHAEKAALAQMARAVRQEKSHWKIESNRVKVIKRNRPRYQAIVSQTQSGRDETYATTISYEKHAQVWDRENLTTEKKLRQDARKQDTENRPKTYVDYAVSVQESYDKVVGNTLALLRGFTLDERTSRLREQAKKLEKKAKKAQKGQFAPLKEENQLKAAFDYLK